MTSAAASAKNVFRPVLDTPDFSKATDVSSSAQVERVFTSSLETHSSAQAHQPISSFHPSVTACEAVIKEMRQKEDESLVVVFRRLCKYIGPPEELLGDTQITAGAIRAWMRRNKETLRQITSLRLCKAGLRSLPPEIGLLTGLRYLYLSDNNLTELPVHMRLLENLKHLDLYSNAFIAVPKVLGYLKLQYLDFSYNQLTEIDGIGRLSSLKELYLFGNKGLRTLPSEIGELNGLEKLSISYCNFSEFPREILQLVNLRELDLSHNQFQGPLVGIERLSRLESLLLIGNPESLFPKLSEETAKLADLSHAKRLARDAS